MDVRCHPIPRGRSGGVPKKRGSVQSHVPGECGWHGADKATSEKPRDYNSTRRLEGSCARIPENCHSVTPKKCISSELFARNCGHGLPILLPTKTSLHSKLMNLIKIVSTSLSLILCVFILPAQAQDAQPAAKQAQVIRSTTGRMLNEQGLAENTVPVRKGFTFDVVSETLADVVLSHNGRKFKMAKSDVIISEKSAEQATASPTGFKPGQIVLISARYTVDGNQPRNVKNRLAKLVPQGVITEPVSIQVTDELSSLAATQGSTTTGTVTALDNNTAVVTLNEAKKNVLTVEYSFNGQVRRKQALEGSMLVLP